MAVDNSWASYALDTAVWEFGSWVEAELDKVEPGKTDRQTQRRRNAKLDAILTGDKAKQYADPAAKFKPK